MALLFRFSLYSVCVLKPRVTIDPRKPDEVVPQYKGRAVALFAGLIVAILGCEPTCDFHLSGYVQYSTVVR